MTNRNFQRAVFAAIATGLILLVVAVLTVIVNLERTHTHTQWVNHSYAVQRALSDYTIYSERIEGIRRGYLLLGDDRMFAKVGKTMHDMPAMLDNIAFLTRDNREQQQRVVRLRAIATSHERSVSRTFAMMLGANAATRSLAGFGVDDSIPTMDGLRAVLSEMFAAETRLLDQRVAEHAAGIRILYAVLALTGLLIAVVMGGMVWIVLHYTNDLNHSQETLRALNSSLEGAVADRTAELQRANEEIQRFAYIVSHDLRSPLVNVMGFTAELEATIAPLTELIDRVDAEAPHLMVADARAAKADLPEAIGFIRTSTTKMDRLINAILRLSREGRRTLVPAPIDLVEMSRTVRAGVQHRLNELGAEIEIVTPMPAIVSDRLALEQIAANLVENSLKYLQPGRPGRIAIGARREGTRVIFDVVDNGRGIDPRDHERIFELFRRSGVQDQTGEGLGLAHVRALAYRLGGVINCLSTLGEGATFRLSLPEVLQVDVRQGAAA